MMEQFRCDAASATGYRFIIEQQYWYFWGSLNWLWTWPMWI